MYFKGKRYETSLVQSVLDKTEVDRTSYCIKEPLAVEFCSRVILLILYKRGMKDSCSPSINCLGAVLFTLTLTSGQ